MCNYCPFHTKFPIFPMKICKQNSFKKIIVDISAQRVNGRSAKKFNLICRDFQNRIILFHLSAFNKCCRNKYVDGNLPETCANKNQIQAVQKTVNLCMFYSPLLHVRWLSSFKNRKTFNPKCRL